MFDIRFVAFTILFGMFNASYFMGSVSPLLNSKAGESGRFSPVVDSSGISLAQSGRFRSVSASGLRFSDSNRELGAIHSVIEGEMVFSDFASGSPFKDNTLLRCVSVWDLDGMGLGLSIGNIHISAGIIAEMRSGSPYSGRMRASSVRLVQEDDPDSPCIITPRHGESLLTEELLDSLLAFPLQPIHQQSVNALLEELPRLPVLGNSDRVALFLRCITEFFVYLRNSLFVDVSADPGVVTFLDLVKGLRFKSVELSKILDSFQVSKFSDFASTFSASRKKLIGSNFNNVFIQLASFSRLAVRSSEFTFVSQFVPRIDQLSSLALTNFCQNIAPNLFRALLQGLDPGMFPPTSVSYVAVMLMNACWRYIDDPDLKLYTYSQLLQSGLQTVEIFTDADVLFAVESSNISDTLERLRGFKKLDLYNEVFVQFLDQPNARGITGLRTTWIENSLQLLKAHLFSSDGYYLKPKPQHTEFEDFRMFGRVIGLALRYHITPGLAFTPGCWAAFVGDNDPSKLENFLAEEDPEMLSNLMKMHTLTDDELKRQFATTRDSLPQFIEDQIAQKVYRSAEMSQIYLGLADTIRFAVLKSLTDTELISIIKGPVQSTLEILHNLKRFGVSHSPKNKKLKHWFWEIIEQDPDTYVPQLLHFVSGSSRVPISGFVAPSNDRNWLEIFFDESMNISGYPRASTCFIRLRIPLYTTKEQMREKLVFALQYVTGIDSDERADIEGYTSTLAPITSIEP